MKNIIAWFILAQLILSLTIILIMQAKKELATDIDYPEEYSIAKTTDTLIGVKKGNTLYLEFKKNY
jgi:hypothetical protein